jgi:amino acid transporter
MENEIGSLNIHLGWIWMVTGIASGSILGMWAFDGPLPAPPNHKDYNDLPRRLVRLAHIAMFMLPLISIVFGGYINSIPLSDETKQLACTLWLICMFGVPTLLIAASFYLPFKYLEVVPVTSGFVALCIMGYGHYLLL